MRNRKKMVSILAGVLAALMLLSLILSILPAVSAASSSEIKQQINELKDQKAELREEIQAIKNQYQKNEDEIADIVAQKNVIDQEIFYLNEEITNTNQQIAAYSLLIADKQDELDAANKRLTNLNEKNKERIRAMEEDGKLSYWAVLFKANSFADLLDRLNMVEEIAASDQRRLKELSEAAQQVSQAREALAAEKAELEVTKEELNETQLTLDAKREEADALITKLIETSEKLQIQQEELEKEDEDLLAEIAQKEKEYNTAKHQEWLAYMATYTTVPPATTAPKPTTNGSGSSGATSNAKWLRPCSYIMVSSPFGNRESPTAGASSYHQGIDLAANSGTPIYATRSGVVTIATYSNSAGYYVTINHGDGFSSVYMHMTGYTVSAGQAVSAGQLIGYVGSTGISTGPHLHFGISYNGRYVNPAAYIAF